MTLSQSPTPTPYKVDIVTPPADTPLFKWYLIFTAFGVILNAAIFVLILKQTKLTKIAAEAGKTSAETAKNSAEFAEKALRHSERADILLYEAGLSTGQDMLPHTQAVLRFKNYGHTRANAVFFEMALTVQGEVKTDMKHGPMILGANAEQSVYFNLASFMGSDFSKIFSGQAEMAFSGKVSYIDVFGFPHSTFCTGTFIAPTRTFRVDKNEGD